MFWGKAIDFRMGEAESKKIFDVEVVVGGTGMCPWLRCYFGPFVRRGRHVTFYVPPCLLSNVRGVVV